jgi:hypothetical protein
MKNIVELYKKFCSNNNIPFNIVKRLKEKHSNKSKEWWYDTKCVKNILRDRAVVSSSGSYPEGGDSNSSLATN